MRIDVFGIRKKIFSKITTNIKSVAANNTLANSIKAREMRCASARLSCLK